MLALVQFGNDQGQLFRFVCFASDFGCLAAVPACILALHQVSACLLSVLDACNVHIAGT
jgi:hypothetical protein